MEEKIVLTIKETAKAFNVPEFAIRTLVKRGAFPVVQVGNRCYIMHNIFEEYLKAGAQSMTPTKFNISVSTTRGEKTNTSYPYRIEINNADDLKKVAKYDHTGRIFRNFKRKTGETVKVHRSSTTFI